MNRNHYIKDYCTTPVQLKSRFGPELRYTALLRYLVQYCKIEQGYGAAFYLGYPDYLDNHLAVANWLDCRLRKTKAPYRPIGHLKAEIQAVLPEQYLLKKLD